MSAADAKDSPFSVSGGPNLNLRQTVQVGVWNVRTLRQDHSLGQLSCRGSTCWRGPNRGMWINLFLVWTCPDAQHTHGVAVADWPLPAVDNIRCISDRLMGLRLRYSMGAPTVVSVYTPSSVGDEGDNDSPTLLISERDRLQGIAGSGRIQSQGCLQVGLVALFHVQLGA